MRLREALEKSGIQQKELAARMRVSPSTVSQWVSGKREPDNDTIVGIADALGVSTDYLLGAKSKKAAASDDDIKVALFGGDGEVTDEMWEEVKRFAAFVKQNRRNK